MPNMDPKKCPMPVQDPEVRNKNFSEVALGYTADMAVNEAKRCLHCKNKPCVSGCPVGIDIPGFIAKVAEEDFEGAFEVLSASSALPAVCGRVCPQENQCEGKCVRGIKTMVSMNPIMIDGTGRCGGCRLTVGGKTKFACVDGPDFDGHEVDFDEAMHRGGMYRDFEAHAREAECNLLKKEVE